MTLANGSTGQNLVVHGSRAYEAEAMEITRVSLHQMASLQPRR